MTIKRQTLEQLETRIIADIEGRIIADSEARTEELGELDTRPRHSLIGILARALAGAMHELYGYLDFVADQIFDDTAGDEQLQRRAAQYGITLLPAVPAKGEIVVTGTSGAVVPAGTRWRSSTSGQEYESVAEATLINRDSESLPPGAQVRIQAVLPGVDGNLPANDPVNNQLTMINPIPEVDAKAFVTADGITGGADLESIDSLRRRLRLRRVAPPRGGTKTDYEQWALAAHPHVTRAWTFPRTPGLGQVTVYVMTDGVPGNGIPTSTVIDAVKARINVLRPVTAEVFVYAPTPKPLNIEISGISPDNDDDVKAAVEASVRDLIRRESKPGEAILISHLREAISTAAGEYDHTLVKPATITKPAAGHIYVLGQVTFEDS